MARRLCMLAAVLVTAAPSFATFVQGERVCLNGLWEFVPEENLSPDGSKLRPPSPGRGGRILVPSPWDMCEPRDIKIFGYPEEWREVVRGWYLLDLDVPARWRGGRSSCGWSR